MSVQADKIISDSCSYIMQSHLKFDENLNTKVKHNKIFFCLYILFNIGAAQDWFNSLTHEYPLQMENMVYVPHPPSPVLIMLGSRA